MNSFYSSLNLIVLFYVITLLGSLQSSLVAKCMEFYQYNKDLILDSNAAAKVCVFLSFQVQTVKKHKMMNNTTML